jgi:hypothetical protein
MSNTKTRAIEIYQQHIALASTDGRLFRKTVMDQIMAELGVSLASAATSYNNCKKAVPVEGLGRPTVTKGARKVTIGGKGGKTQDIIPDNECFTVIELVADCIGRTQAFSTQGDASEAFDSKTKAWPRNTWVLIQGLGPNAGDTYKLESDEKEVKRYSPEVVTA